MLERWLGQAKAEIFKAGFGSGVCFGVNRQDILIAAKIKHHRDISDDPIFRRGKRMGMFVSFAAASLIFSLADNATLAPGYSQHQIASLAPAPMQHSEIGCQMNAAQGVIAVPCRRQARRGAGLFSLPIT